MLVVHLPPSGALPQPAEPAPASASTLSPPPSTRRSTRSRSSTASSLATPPPPPAQSDARAASGSARPAKGAEPLSAQVSDYPVPSRAEAGVPSFGRSSKDVERDVARVWEALASARRVVVICGAGISVSEPANIPDFRSATGLFRKLKEKHPTAGLSSGKDLFDARLFGSESTSSLFYSMISELKTLADAAQPTVFHRLLKRLDDEGRLLRVYTQNIDNLEERAGLSFGLGETGDSTTTARALGKRKRDEKARAAATSGKQDLGKGAPVGVRAQWGRSVSDSALLKSHQERFESLTPEPSSTTPMFPRTIPLHGSLSALTCSVCTYKLYLSPPTLESAPDSVAGSSTRRQSPGAPEREADRVQALAMLAAGEPVPCSKCADYEEVRAVAGLRSRGVGIMKVGVVLYGGQNEGAEQVGECLQRDILGLRDPNEPAVPETAAERKARERKAKKEADKVASSIEPVKSLPFTPGGLQPIVEIGGDEAFAAAFNDPDDAAAEAELLLPSSSLAAKPAQVRAARVPRLKPLPPDLLIVAGTSLKVPGTKRIVREFAKACRARDHRVYSDESDDEEDADGSRISPRPRRGAAGRRSTRSRSAGADSAESGSGDEPDESDEDEDINAPIRSILLNYDFPGPSREWEDVFDVWVQGDVQRAALGLWEASAYPVTETHVRSMAPGTAGASLEQYSWASSMAYLESERIREKREARSAARRANSPGASSATSSAARRGKAAVAKDTALPNSKARRTKLEQSPSTATQSPSASPSPTKKPRASGPAKKRAAGKAATDSEAAPSLKSGRKASAVEGEAQSKPTSRAFSRSKSSSHAETAAQPAAARRRLAAVRRNSVSNAPSVVLDNGLARAYAGTKGGAGSTGERARRIIKLE